MAKETFEEFAQVYLPADVQTIEVPGDAEAWPVVVVKHGKYTAVVQFMGLGSHLCIDVHPFVDGKAARAGVFGMEEGRRIEAFADAASGGTSRQLPATRLVAVLIGEQG